VIGQAIQEFAIPTASSLPQGIVLDIGDDTPWFTEYVGNKIGHVTKVTGKDTAVIAEYPVPTPSSRPNGITQTCDGQIWFTEFTSGRIGTLPSRIASVREYPVARMPVNIVPVVRALCGGLANQDLFYTDLLANGVNVINESGVERYDWSDQTPNVSANGIASSENGAYQYFTETSTGKIVRVPFPN
jgi:streptogramin lyase